MFHLNNHSTESQMFLPSIIEATPDLRKSSRIKRDRIDPSFETESKVEEVATVNLDGIRKQNRLKAKKSRDQKNKNLEDLEIQFAFLEGELDHNGQKLAELKQKNQRLRSLILEKINKLTAIDKSLEES